MRPPVLLLVGPGVVLCCGVAFGVFSRRSGVGGRSGRLAVRCPAFLAVWLFWCARCSALERSPRFDGARDRARWARELWRLLPLSARRGRCWAILAAVAAPFSGRQYKRLGGLFRRAFRLRCQAVLYIGFPCVSNLGCPL